MGDEGNWRRFLVISFYNCHNNFIYDVIKHLHTFCVRLSFVLNAFLMTFYYLFFRFVLPISTVVSNPPTLQPGLAATQSPDDAFDDDDIEEAITNENDNIINIVDKCNFLVHFLFRKYLQSNLLNNFLVCMNS